MSTLDQIRQYQNSRKDCVELARKHIQAGTIPAHPEVRLHGYVDFLLTAIDKLEQDIKDLDHDVNAAVKFCDEQHGA